MNDFSLDENVKINVETIFRPNLLEKQIFDTPTEAEKCRKRFDNFLKMFTRNYLYSIDLMVEYFHKLFMFMNFMRKLKMEKLNDYYNLQMSEIQSNKYYTPASFALKAYAMYNIFQIATSTYVLHVRNYLERDIPPKILDFLNSIRETTIICVERGLFDVDDCMVQVRNIT